MAKITREEAYDIVTAGLKEVGKAFRDGAKAWKALPNQSLSVATYQVRQTLNKQLAILKDSMKNAEIGSKPILENIKEKLEALMRQLNLPTFVSDAEELLSAWNTVLAGLEDDAEELRTAA